MYDQKIKSEFVNSKRNYYIKKISFRTRKVIYWKNHEQITLIIMTTFWSKTPDILLIQYNFEFNFTIIAASWYFAKLGSKLSLISVITSDHGKVIFSIIAGNKKLRA